MDELYNRGIVEVDTSPNEARKTLLDPAWTAGQKITMSNIQLPNESVPFLVQNLVPSTTMIGGLEVNKLPGKFFVG